MSFYSFSRLSIHFIVFLCLALAQVAPSQDKDQKPKNSVKEDRLDEVRFNLSALDGSGKPIDNIKAEDLKIFENDKEQKITYFAKKEPVLNLGLIIDNSFSLQNQLPLVVALSKWFSNNLKNKDEGLLIRFVNSEKIGILQDWTSDKGLLNQAADRMVIEGGSTAIIDALYVSAEKMEERMKQDNSKRYALIVISDCEDRDSYYKLKDVFAKVEGTDLQIFVIGLVKQLDNKTSNHMVRSTPYERAIKVAQRIAAKTGGIAYFPEADKASNYTMVPTAEAIMTELRSQYIIGYVPANQKTDDKKRTLRVEITDSGQGEKRSVVVRDGFFFR